MCSAQGNPEGSMTLAHRPAVEDLKRRFAAATESRAELTANSASITAIATGEKPMVRVSRRRRWREEILHQLPPQQQ